MNQLVCLIFCCLGLSFAFGDNYPDESQVVWVSVSDLRATQKGVGFYQLGKRIAEINSKVAPGDLKEYLLEESLRNGNSPIRTVFVESNKKYYVFDRHHLISSLVRSKYPNDDIPTIEVPVIVDMRVKSEKNLLKLIKNRKNKYSFWQYDFLAGIGYQRIRLNKRTIDLNIAFSRLGDDPIRSLGKLLRKDGKEYQVLERGTNPPFFFEFRLGLLGYLVYKKSLQDSSGIQLKKKTGSVSCDSTNEEECEKKFRSKKIKKMAEAIHLIACDDSPSQESLMNFWKSQIETHSKKYPEIRGLLKNLTPKCG